MQRPVHGPWIPSPETSAPGGCGRAGEGARGREVRGPLALWLSELHGPPFPSPEASGYCWFTARVRRINSGLRAFRRMSPWGTCFRPVGSVCAGRQAAQAIHLPHALPRPSRSGGGTQGRGQTPSPGFKSVGARRPCNRLEVCQQYRFSSEQMGVRGGRTCKRISTCNNLVSILW